MQFVIVAASSAGVASAIPDKVTYNAHIRSFLSDKCIACHGPDDGHREAGLRLDTPEGAYSSLKDDSSSFAIVPHHPEKSAIFKRIDSDDEEEVMPPPHFHKIITKEERELLWKWVEQGAEYEPHWAYTPIKKKESRNKTKNPIDGFILDRLEEEKLEPLLRARPAQLLRRLSLDLTGLPPTAGQLASFEKAAARDFDAAYEAEVTRLLASPRFGERMAVPWLDTVRYADTVGFHGDQNVRIFPYRDYVIKAFNENFPFDRFVREQLAGDLLENATPDQLVASGFNRLNLMSREGGAQPKEYLAKSAADRVRAIGQAFLGQTTGCAECHDHKFDPISARDFYALGAFFDDVLQWGIYQKYPYSVYDGLQGVNNDSPFPPEVVVRSDSQLELMKNLQQKMISYLSTLNVGEKELELWKEKVLPILEAHHDGWIPAKVLSAESSKNTPHQILEDGSVEFTGKARRGDVLTLTMDLSETPLGSLRFEALPSEAAGGTVGRGRDGSFLIRSLPKPKKEGKRASRNSQLSFAIRSEDGTETPLSVIWSQANLYSTSLNAYRSGSPKKFSINDSWTSAPGRLEIPRDLAKQKQTGVFSLKSKVTTQPGDVLVARFESADIARLRISATPFLESIPGEPVLPVDVLAGIKSGNVSHLKAAYHLSTGSLEKLSKTFKILRSRLRETKAGWSRSLTTVVRPKKDWRVSRVLSRGDWQDDKGPVVEPAVFGFLPSESVPKDRRLNRLDLANWIVADENPLTARHFVNRTWRQFFGSGLSNVLADLGAQGEWPSHPKLLDWLAADFRENNWDVKRIIKLMVTSEAYQREAATNAEITKRDPGYRLHAQQAPRRLDAEFVRDNALAISGLLNTEITGGPSIKPYQPEGYYNAINFPRRRYSSTRDERQYRRGVYMHWQRTFLHPMLANFDAPNRAECSVDRLQANSPQQALTLLNDPSYTEAARAFAVRLLSDSKQGDDAALIKAGYLQAIAREPREDELKSLTEFLAKQRENIASGKDNPDKLLKIGLYRAPSNLDKKELAAVTQLCRVILNLHETITRY